MNVVLYVPRLVVGSEEDWINKVKSAFGDKTNVLVLPSIGDYRVEVLPTS